MVFFAEEVGRECTCAHPGEGEPSAGEKDVRCSKREKYGRDRLLEIGSRKCLLETASRKCLLAVYMWSSHQMLGCFAWQATVQMLSYHLFGRLSLLHHYAKHRLLDMLQHFCCHYLKKIEKEIRYLKMFRAFLGAWLLPPPALYWQLQ